MGYITKESGENGVLLDLQKTKETVINNRVRKQGPHPAFPPLFCKNPTCFSSVSQIQFFFSRKMH